MSFPDNSIKFIKSFQSELSSAKNYEAVELFNNAANSYKKCLDICKFLESKDGNEIKEYFTKNKHYFELKTKLMNSIDKFEEKSKNEKSIIDFGSSNKSNEPLLAQRETIQKEINELIKLCSDDIARLSEINAKNNNTLGQSFLMEKIVVDQKSYIMPKFNQQQEQFTSEDDPKENLYMEDLQSGFEQIHSCLVKLLEYFEKESVLVNDRDKKINELNELKKNYSILKRNLQQDN